MEFLAFIDRVKFDLTTISHKKKKSPNPVEFQPLQPRRTPPTLPSVPKKQKQSFKEHHAKTKRTVKRKVENKLNLLLYDKYNSEYIGNPSMKNLF